MLLTLELNPPLVWALRGGFLDSRGQQTSSSLTVPGAADRTSPEHTRQQHKSVLSSCRGICFKPSSLRRSEPRCLNQSTERLRCDQWCESGSVHLFSAQQVPVCYSWRLLLFMLLSSVGSHRGLSWVPSHSQFIWCVCNFLPHWNDKLDVKNILQFNKFKLLRMII